MLQVFRMMTEIDNVQKINQSIQIEQASTRGHKLKSLSLDVKPILRKIHLHSGNALSNDVLEAKNINQFK